jgi:hypothetical protein
MFRIRDKNGAIHEFPILNGDAISVIVQGGENVTYPVADEPTTIGQMACLARVKQLCDLTFTAKGVLPHHKGDYEAGTTITGAPYSATRILDNYIGYKISLHTFMTAVNNPRSRLYTQTVSGYGGNLKCWYGITCSTFVAYCYDLDYPIQTYIFPDLDGIEEVSLEDMQICDAANVRSDTATTGGHIIIITGIERDADGNIAYVTIAEANGTGATSRRISIANFKKTYTNEGYKIYRNRKLYAASYQPSEYVRLFEDEPTAEVVYSDLCTDWGDQATIRTDESITLQPLVTDGYTAIKLYKDGAECAEYAVGDVTLANLATGHYTAKLVPETANASTSFTVCAVTAVKYKRTTRYVFSADGAVPHRVLFKDSNGFTLGSVKLEEDDLLRGYKDIDLPEGEVDMVQAVFKNEYGYVLADVGEAEMDVALPFEYQEVAYIETDANQYVDTGVLASDYADGIAYTMRGAITGKGASAKTDYLFGASDGTSRSGNIGLTTANALALTLGGNSSTLFSRSLTEAFGYEYGQDFTLELFATSADLTTATASFNNTDITVIRGNGTESAMPAANIWLFACNGVEDTNGNRRYKGKLYSFAMTAADGIPIRNFVPCYRKADDVIGLYDTVGGVFYTNSGTGAFTKGADV